MAIVQNPIVGRSSGKFANAIFSKNYQKNIIRSKPIEVRDAKSTAQLNQRQAFKVIQTLMSALLPVVRIGFLGIATDKSAFSHAMKVNLPEALTGTAGAKTIDPSKLELSSGTLAQLQNVTWDRTSADTLTITWDTTLPTFENSNDEKVNLILFDPITGISEYSINATTRDTGSLTYTISDAMKVVTSLQAYIFTNHPDQKAGSDLATKVKRSGSLTV
jgi:hypothetical protein